MKKTIWAVLILIQIASICCAQKDSSFSPLNNKKKFSAFISINVGMGVPTNSFYMQELAGLPGGCNNASVGYCLNILWGIPIAHNHFGLAGIFGYDAEPFNVNQCFLEMCEKDNTNQLISGSYTDFKETLLMIGGYFCTKGKLRIDFKLMAGDNLFTIPNYSLSGTSSFSYGIGMPINGVSYFTRTTYFMAHMQSASSSTVVFDFGISFWLLQKKHLFVVFGPDFMYSQGYINTTYTGYGTFTFFDHFRVNYNLLSFTTGFGYKL